MFIKLLSRIPLSLGGLLALQLLASNSAGNCRSSFLLCRFRVVRPFGAAGCGGIAQVRLLFAQGGDVVRGVASERRVLEQVVARLGLTGCGATRTGRPLLRRLALRVVHLVHKREQLHVSGAYTIQARDFKALMKEVNK